MDSNSKFALTIIGVFVGIFLGIIVLICVLPKSKYERWVDDRTVDMIHQDGHQYLVFKFSGQYGMGVVHNPDCPCFKKILIEEPE